MAEKKIDSFNKRCYGLVIIKSENSNWNADFTGFPRRLPDENATIYATDKALKYAIRKYWIDNNEKVFVWKSFKKVKDELIPNTLEDRFKLMSDKLKSEDPVEIFAKCIDTKFFGITFAMKSLGGENKNISLTGPMQISYGINKYNDNTPYSNDILSPYADQKSKDKDAKSSTIGNEIKTKKSYYVYDFSLNPQNILNHYEEIPEIAKEFKFSDTEIDLMKQALNKAATNLNSTTKQGSENVLTIFITLKEGSKLQIPTLKNVISVTEKENIGQIDFSALSELLKKYKDIELIEISSNDTLLTLENVDPNWKKIDILL